MKIEDLKVKDELVCVDLDYFRSKASDHPFLKNDVDFTIISKWNNFIEIPNQLYISIHELKYFKKKEQPTFNDLIDVAHQAYKDRLLFNLFLTDEYIEFDANDIDYSYQFINMFDAIKIIKSLYKETFVIESEEDINRLNRRAEVTLKNGEVIFFAENGADGCWLEFDGCGADAFPFIALKGATVEQERVSNE